MLRLVSQVGGSAASLVRRLASLGIKSTHAGDGKTFPQPGQTVSVHYTGRFTNGGKFDSSVDRGEPLKFTVGVGQVIRGWDEGLLKLSKGEKAVLTCPPEYAYGERGFPGFIPGNATLVFDVELVDIE